MSCNCNSEHSKETILTLSITDTIKVKPDTAVLTITVANEDDNDLCKTYEEAAKVGAKKLNHLMEIIKELGVASEYVKASKLSVRPSHTSVNTKKETVKILGSREIETSYARKLLGYEYSATIGLKLPSDNEDIAKIYCKLSAEDDAKKVDVGYILVETETWHDKLIDKLIKKAQHKAEIVAHSSRQEVGKLVEIDFTNRANMYNNLVFANNCSMDFCEYDECCDMEFEDNVSDMLDAMANTEKELSETVTIKYLLK